ncbi:acyltransferase family protein, partial [Algibacter sp.]
LVYKYLFNSWIQIISYVGILVVIFFLPSSLNDAKHIFLGFLFIIIILNVSSNNRSFIKLENNFFRFLGNISYGMYMYHMIIVGGLISLIKVSEQNIFISNIVLYILVLGLTVLISYLSYKFIEMPFLKLKGKFTKVSSGHKL